MANGRTVLGNDVATEAFQLFRLLGFDSLAEALSLEEAERAQVQYTAGMAMGRALVRRGTLPAGDVQQLLAAFADFYKRMGLGLVYSHTHADGSLAIGIEECAGCVGSEPAGRPICHVEAGLVQGVVSEALGEDYAVNEQKCIGGMGDTACEFALHRE